ncbi:hypothetical protein GGR44_001361 [Sphingobium fontiphilum]|uniref:Uncharacterized protein n=1 Tax=Sphingobium fontiphilum TaxID=944425 RepID=A0A7W6DFM3_9SPHN|nr:hypothetical protein [Sphingobium fontiphilum]
MMKHSEEFRQEAVRIAPTSGRRLTVGRNDPRAHHLIVAGALRRCLATIANLMSSPSHRRDEFFQDVAFRLHLAVRWKGTPRIGGELPYPFAQHVLVHIHIASSLCHRTPRSRTNRTASSLNARLNFLRCIVDLRQVKSSCLGIRQTGSRPHHRHLI